MSVVNLYESPIGTLLLAADENGLTGLWIKEQKYYAATLPAENQADPKHPILKAASLWLNAYFEGGKPAISDLPLAPNGSLFRQQVWKLLIQIPYGKTISYGELAAEMAKQNGLSRMSAQAIGGAVGHNPISVIIPCHRVTGADGNLTGYAGGIQRKFWLLKHEGVDTSALYIPKKGTAL